MKIVHKLYEHTGFANLTEFTAMMMFRAIGGIKGTVPTNKAVQMLKKMLLQK